MVLEHGPSWRVHHPEHWMYDTFMMLSGEKWKMREMKPWNIDFKNGWSGDPKNPFDHNEAYHKEFHSGGKTWDLLVALRYALNTTCRLCKINEAVDPTVDGECAERICKDCRKGD